MSLNIDERLKPGINDFVIRFANVNGTGSASANSLIAKAIFRMGVPIGPKNMFPSNIQGLPTWFELRVSAKGFTARRGGVDLMVAMNGSTLVNDQKDMRAGSFLLYDSTKPLPKSIQRSDINYLPLPVTEISREKVAIARQRSLLQNMIYVGALAALLKIDIEVIKMLIGEQYKRKEKLIPLNWDVLMLGYEYALQNYSCPINFYIERLQETDHKILLEGNRAIALGCLYAGATVAGWYPITPSTSVIESFSNLCKKYRTNDDGSKNYSIIQAEDEIAACGIVLGAMWNGARAFTATSGPGISLMNEFLGYAYYAEIPAVIFNIQRNGPSTGMPTRNQQSDLLLCAFASHGDTNHILLFPSNPLECFEMAYKAFDYAERFQTPILVLSDLEIGMNEYLCDPLRWDDNYVHDRGKVLDAKALGERVKPFYRYLDEDLDGICYRTYPGIHPKGAYFTRGSGHDKFGRYTEDGALYQENLDRIVRKFKTAVGELPQPVVTKRSSDGLQGVIHFGSSREAVEEALHLLSNDGLAIDDIRILSYPFSQSALEKLKSYQRLLVVEQNRDGQLTSLLYQTATFSPGQLHSICRYDGLPLQAEPLAKDIKSILTNSH